MNRRFGRDQWLSSASLLLSLVLSLPSSAEDSPLATLVDGHPRVLLRSGEIDELRRRMRTNEVLQHWGDALRRDA